VLDWLHGGLTVDGDGRVWTWTPHSIVLDRTFCQAFALVPSHGDPDKRGRRWYEFDKFKLNTRDEFAHERAAMVLAFLRSLWEALEDADPIFGGGACLLTDCSQLALELFAIGDLTHIVSVMKYVTAYPMAAWLRNPLPKAPQLLQAHDSQRHWQFGINARHLTQEAAVDALTSGPHHEYLEDYLPAYCRSCWLEPGDMPDHWKPRYYGTGQVPVWNQQYWRRFPMFSGMTQRHLRNLVASRTSSTRSAKVFVALLQGAKRGCRTVPDSFIASAMRDHQAALSKEYPPLAEASRLDYQKKFETLWAHVVPPGIDARDFTVLADEEEEPRVYRKSRYQNWKSWERHSPVPGGGACVGSRRSDGGRLGFFHNVWEGSDLAHPTLSDIDIRRRNLSQWLWDNEREPIDLNSQFPSGGGPTKLTTVEVHTGRPGGRAPWSISATLDRPLIAMAFDTRRGDFSIYGIPKVHYRAVLLAADTHDGAQLEAEVAPVCEPLKCRLITKGSPLSYHAAAPAQRAMWKHLSAMDPFGLIKCPLDQSHLHGLLHREHNIPGIEKFDHWVSGDYKAATDGLSQEINSLCFEAFLKRANASPLEARVWRAVLGNHWIRYPHKYDDDLPVHAFRQKCGQLMGSPLSFPVLCSINLVAYWRALEEYTGQSIADPRSLPVLVNGDDILFRSDQEFYEVWQRHITEAGFTLSLGKNYISPNVLSVNSQYFLHRRDCEGRSKSFEEVTFLQTGILIPGSGIRPENLDAPWIDRMNCVLASANDPERAFRRILHYWPEKVQQVTDHGRFALVGDTRLGACGLQFPGFSGYFTHFQCKLAQYLHDRLISLNNTVQRVADLPKLAIGKLCLFLDGVRSFRPTLQSTYRTVVFRDPREPLRQNELRSDDVSHEIGPRLWPGSYPAAFGVPTHWEMRPFGADVLQRFRAWLKSSPSRYAISPDTPVPLEPRVLRDFTRASEGCGAAN